VGANARPGRLAVVNASVLGAAGLIVAVLGFLVNSLAIRREQGDRKRQFDDEWAREWASQRPVVYPLALFEWTHRSGRYELPGNARLLPLKNGGRGVALEVKGEMTATTPDGTSYSRELLAGPIAAGDLLDARIAPNPGIEHWQHATGVIRYRDLAGGAYETRFESSLGAGGELVLTVHEQTHLTDADAPTADGP